jgi:hypothetical protein
MRKVVKISGYSLGGLLALLTAYIAILAYPGVLFAHSVDYANFTVHSDDEIPGIEPILQKVERAVETSEIYDPALKHDIFFGYGNRSFTLMQDVHSSLVSRAIGRGSGRAPTYNVSLPPYVSNIVTFYSPVIESDSLVHPDGSGRVNQSLSRTLAHEVVHTFLMAELGLQRIAHTAMWKQEGYADYVAASATILADPDYRIRESVERILRQDLSWLVDAQGRFDHIRYGCLRYGVLRDEEGRLWNTCYYISRVLVEYVLDHKGMTFQELMSPAIRDGELLTELVAAYEDGTLR